MSSIASAISGSAFLITVGLILVSSSMFYVGIQIKNLLIQKNSNDLSEMKEFQLDNFTYKL